MVKRRKLGTHGQTLKNKALCCVMEKADFYLYSM